MKIKSLQISNVWTFKHYDDINGAPKISFDKNFNILIGQNGAGKSTIVDEISRQLASYYAVHVFKVL